MLGKVRLPDGVPVKLTEGLEADSPYIVQNQGNAPVRVVLTGASDAAPGLDAGGYLMHGRADPLYGLPLRLEFAADEAYWAFTDGWPGLVNVDKGIS